jgi:hypothetical protein
MQDAETATSVPASDDDQLLAYLKASRSSLSMSDVAPLAVTASTLPQATTSDEIMDEVADEDTDKEIKEATETEKQWWFEEKRIRIDESR